jgi:hypothetical protein
VLAIVALYVSLAASVSLLLFLRWLRFVVTLQLLN